MRTNATQSRKVVGGRPAYILVGTDADGAQHVYRTTDETVHVIDDCGREEVQSVAAHGIEAWLAFVGDRRGWDHCRFTDGLAAMMTRAGVA
jgi:hypothetical protein